MKCLTHDIEVNYPCSPACPLYGDCIASFSREAKRRVRTNADHIRAMSDEELASEMSQRSISTVCDIVCQGDCKAIATLNKTCGDVCKEIIIKWLQQPAEEDT